MSEAIALFLVIWAAFTVPLLVAAVICFAIADSDKERVSTKQFALNCLFWPFWLIHAFIRMVRWSA